MAIYHFSVKPVSRSAGRSATGAAAYRAAEKVIDQRTGEVHDYTRKAGVVSAELVLPDVAEWKPSRAELWNAAELSEKRKDACVAREFEVALPAELSPDQRKQLANDFAKDMANREGCAVDVCIHEPSKGGDQKNHHAHMLRTTRKVDGDGLGAKLDTEQAGRKRADDLEAVRARWAELTNTALARAGHCARVDHRSLAAQGIERVPTEHKGPTVTAMERRGEPTRVGLDMQQRAAATMAARQQQATTRSKAHERSKPQRRQPARIADLPNLHRVHSVHDASGDEGVLRSHAPDHLRQPPVIGASDEVQQLHRSAGAEQRVDAEQAAQERRQEIERKVRDKTATMTAAEIRSYSSTQLGGMVSASPAVKEAERRRQVADRQHASAYARLEALREERSTFKPSALRRLLPKSLDRAAQLDEQIAAAELAERGALKRARAETARAIEAKGEALASLREKYTEQFATLEKCAAEKSHQEQLNKAHQEQQEQERKREQEAAARAEKTEKEGAPGADARPAHKPLRSAPKRPRGPSGPSLG